jgi:hypothetical protein
LWLGEALPKMAMLVLEIFDLALRKLQERIPATGKK